jgi:hypothetical protein
LEIYKCWLTVKKWYHVFRTFTGFRDGSSKGKLEVGQSGSTFESILTFFFASFAEGCGDIGIKVPQTHLRVSGFRDRSTVAKLIILDQSGSTWLSGQRHRDQSASNTFTRFWIPGSIYSRKTDHFGPKWIQVRAVQLAEGGMNDPPTPTKVQLSGPRGPTCRGGNE